MDKIKVYVAIPCYDAKPYAEVVINIFQQELPDNIELEFNRSHIIDGLPVQLARNQIVYNFLKKSDAQYLRQIDADNPCDLTTLKYLVEANKDAISAVVPLRQGEGTRYCIVRDGKPMTSFEGITEPVIEVQNIGTGCCLLSRQLCEDVWKLTKGHPYQFVVSDYVFNELTKSPEPYDNQDAERGWRDIYRNKGESIYKVQRMVGEDLRFGEQAAKLGYKFYCDIRAHCYHYTGKPPKRTIPNEDRLISDSFIIKQKAHADFPDYPYLEAGYVLNGSDDADGEVEVKIFGGDSDGGQVGEGSTEGVSSES